jgi:hypothetical protein
MARRGNPIWHWSIVLFIIIAVGVGVLLLPMFAHWGGWNLEHPTRRDRKFIGITLGGLIVLQLMLWVELMTFLRDWRERRQKKIKNPYDQR